MRRLEWRWERRLAKWTNAATTVKAGYRGMIGRRYFKTIRGDLILKKNQREAKTQAIIFFKDGKYDLTIDALNNVAEMSCELYLIRAKVYYIKNQYEDCYRDSRIAQSI